MNHFEFVPSWVVNGARTRRFPHKMGGVSNTGTTPGGLVPGGGGGTPNPPLSEQVITSLQPFNDALAQYNSQFFDANFQAFDPAALMAQLQGQAGGVSATGDQLLQSLLGLQGGVTGAVGQNQQQIANLLGAAGGVGAQSQAQLASLMAQLGGQQAGVSSDLQSVLGGIGGLQAQTQQMLGGLQGRSGQIGAQAAGTFGTAESALQSILGGNDPRFAALREARQGELNTQQTAEENTQRAELARQGITGANAENMLAQTRGRFDQARRGLTADIGMAEMGRQDQALSNLTGLAGQRAGTLSSVLGQEGGFGQAQLGGMQSLLGMRAGAQQAAQSQLQSLLGMGAGFGQQNIGNQQNMLALQQQMGQAGFQNQIAGNAQLQALLQGASGMNQTNAMTMANLLGMQGQMGFQGAGQANEALNFSLDATTAGLENLLANPQMLIALLAAQNAGQQPPQSLLDQIL